MTQHMFVVAVFLMPRMTMFDILLTVSIDSLLRFVLGPIYPDIEPFIRNNF